MDAKPFDEERGIVVSRDMLAAVGTDMLAGRKVLRDPAEAPMTDLTRAPRVDEYSVLAERICLECCLPGETAPRGVGDRLREAVVPKHPNHVQLLQDKDVVLFEYRVDQLALEVLPLSLDVQVEPGKPPAEPPAAPGPLQPAVNR